MKSLDSFIFENNQPTNLGKKILNIIGASPNQVMFDLVDNAQISKASELWDNVKRLSSEKRNKLFRIVEIIIEDDMKN